MIGQSVGAESGRVQQIIDAWAAAVRAGDIDGVLAHHASDVLLFDVIEPLQTRGIEAYRRSWVEQFFPWYGQTGRFELREVRVSAGDRVAFATGIIDCAGTERGQPVSFTLRLTVCLEKRDDEWLVVHEHHSEPLARADDAA